MDSETAEQLTARQRAVWTAGDWPKIAPLIQQVADETVEAIGVGAGDDYLDVATGSGNAAEAAARRGARVTGLDLIPELVDVARARFDGADLEGSFVVGDAEELPFEADSFDRITSIFGAIFAPRHQVAADELVRVARPGAMIAVTGWTPEGINGQLIKILAERMPPPPDGFEPPALWGVEDHVSELFAGPGLELRFEKRMATMEFESADRWMEYTEENLGPVVMAKALLEPQGQWDAVRADLAALQERSNEVDDGSVRARAEYLLTMVSVQT
ncbi:MAG TPA: methyltransferase domain-containing protein [Solirubrobacterales bacterium]|jgi:SAM-dependent methyltransferase